MNSTSATPTPVQTTENLQHWRPLLELATREVFELMVGGKLQSATEADEPRHNLVTAFIGIGGDLCGVISIVTTTEAAKDMTSAMLGITPEGVGEQAWDALGEICNMVAGNFKDKLAATVEHCVLALPTVITGADYRLRVRGDSAVLELKLLYRHHLLRVLLETLALPGALPDSVSCVP